MKEQEIGRFSPRARKLFSRAFSLGIDPTHLRQEANQVLENVQLKGKERVTRGDLNNLRQKVLSIMDAAQGSGFKTAEAKVSEVNK